MLNLLEMNKERKVLLKSFEQFRIGSNRINSVKGGLADVGSSQTYRYVTSPGIFFETISTDANGDFSNRVTNIIGRTLSTVPSADNSY
jgi:hypothetical protein